MSRSSQDRQTLTHEAMATTFKVTIAYPETVYARQAAAAALAELDRIEGRLSRYVESSDIFRINRLRAGQSTVVHLDAFECLRIALEVQQATGGAFDVAYGSDSLASAGPRFALDADRHAVRVLAQGVRLDLGGIGKGFALDRMADLLKEWEIPSALLCASTSTLLALDAPPGEQGWAIAIGPEHDLRRIRLANRAMSGSGTSVKGHHIIDPDTRKPADRWLRAWAGAPTAAVSDAISTAFMVMSEEALREYCRGHAEVSAYLLKSPSSPLLTVER